MKSREDIASQCYLNVSDIAKLMKVSRCKAVAIYQEAEKIETGYRPYLRKVKITSVCKVTGFSVNQIKKTATV